MVTRSSGRPTTVPDNLKSFEKNSAAVGFYDVKNHACTHSLKNFLGSHVGSHVVETFVRTLGPSKAERVERTFQERERRKRKRSFGLQWMDLMEKDRLRGSEYRGSYCHNTEPKRLALGIASNQGREMISGWKQSGDDHRLNRLADVCRGVTWVKQQYETTLSSEAQANYKPIDLKTIERHKLPIRNASNVPLGGLQASRPTPKAKSGKNDCLAFLSRSKPSKSSEELASKGSQPTTMNHDGEGAKIAFACGYGPDRWKSESRMAWQPVEGKVRPRGGNLARGFCGRVDYPNQAPNNVALWNGDVFPVHIGNPNHRTFP